MTPALVFSEGPLAGQRVEVDAELVLGREDASLTIDDEEISRRHAVIRPTDGGIEIEDLGSTNGTYVNAVRIESATRLAGGDTVKLGRSVLQVESVRAAATVAAAVVPTPPAPRYGPRRRPRHRPAAPPRPLRSARTRFRGPSAAAASRAASSAPSSSRSRSSSPQPWLWRSTSPIVRARLRALLGREAAPLGVFARSESASADFDLAQNRQRKPK